VAVKGKGKAAHESAIVREDLQRAGFVVNIDKSQWIPSQEIDWLGFTINLSKGEFSVRDSKLNRLRQKLFELNRVELVGAKQIASVVGTIVSMSLALGRVTHLITRSLYAVLNSRESWCQRLTLTKEIQDEVKFWLVRVSEFNGQNIWPKPSALHVVYSDVSSTGFGGYMVGHGSLVASGQWSAEEESQSTTWRELQIVKLVLKSFKEKLANERLHWFTDNQNVVRILQHGSLKTTL